MHLETSIYKQAEYMMKHVYTLSSVEFVMATVKLLRNVNLRSNINTTIKYS